MTSEIPLITNVITLHPDQSVDQAIALLAKHNIRFAPVVEKDGTMRGMFSLRHVLLNLLPVSVTMDHGMQNIDFIIGAAPGAAKRFAKMQARPVHEIMDREYHYIRPSMLLLETIRLLITHGSPLPVVEDGKLIGIVSEQGAISQLSKAG